MLPDDPRLGTLREHLVGTCIYGTGGVRFHIREPLGEGGQGMLFKGNYDEPDGVPIVIKLLRPDALTGDTQRRFQREAAILRQLGGQATPNPNVVRFYDHGSVRLTPPRAGPGEFVDLPFTVLEYVHGMTLRELLDHHARAGAPLPVARTRRLLRQVAGALTAVHALGITHRDLKPSNVLVANEQGVEVAKVTDFGLAKLMDFGPRQTNALAGASLGYAPPEQYERGNLRVGPATDVFAFAAILYECIALRPAFPFAPSESPMRLLDRMLTGPRPTLAGAPLLPNELRARPDVMQAIDAAVARATHPEPSQRQATVAEFWGAVEAPLRSLGEAAAPPGVGAFARSPFPFPHVPFPDVAGPSGPPGFATPPPNSPPPATTPSVPFAGSGAANKTQPLGTQPPPRGTERPPMNHWTFRALANISSVGPLRLATISTDGSEVIALGANGLCRWAGTGWSSLHTSAHLDFRLARGLCNVAPHGVLILGDAGLVAIIGRTGTVEGWPLPVSDLNLFGAYSDQTGILLAGERRGLGVGAVVDAPYGRPPTVRAVEGAQRLRAVARLASGEVIACGDNGALLRRVETGATAVVPWGRTGHLLGIAARRDGGAFVVGTGGHALSLGPSLDAALEPVQTTRDLHAVTIADDGTAWACGGDGRVVSRHDGVWQRVPLDNAPTAAFLAVRCTADRVLLLAEDGLILEGRKAL